MPPIPIIRVYIFGDEHFRRRLHMATALTADMKPVLEEIATDMMRVTRATFAGQGRRYGGSWHALDPATVQRKLKEGLDPRILIATRKLMNSVTRRGDENQILEIGPHTIHFGSSLPYAEVQQRGRVDPYVPSRRFIDFYPQDRLRWSGMVKRALKEAILG